MPSPEVARILLVGGRRASRGLQAARYFFCVYGVHNVCLSVFDLRVAFPIPGGASNSLGGPPGCHHRCPLPLPDAPEDDFRAAWPRRLPDPFFNTDGYVEGIMRSKTVGQKGRRKGCSHVSIVFRCIWMGIEK